MRAEETVLELASNQRFAAHQRRESNPGSPHYHCGHAQLCGAPSRIPSGLDFLYKTITASPKCIALVYQVPSPPGVEDLGDHTDELMPLETKTCCIPP